MSNTLSSVMSDTSLILNKTHRTKAYTSRIRFLFLRASPWHAQRFIDYYTSPYASVHYMITNDQPSKIYQFLEDDYQAYSMTGGSYGGRSDLDATSLVIGIVQPETEEVSLQKKIWTESDKTQLDDLASLCKLLIKKHNIHPTRIISSLESLPEESMRFYRPLPWQELYKRGVGVWPDPEEVKKQIARVDTSNIKKLQENLKAYGYSINVTGHNDKKTKAIIWAFQTRFRPDHVSGEIDAETMAMSEILLKTYPQ